MSIVSSPAAASPSTVSDGSLANPTSCSPSEPCQIFRRLFLDGLEAAFRRGDLGFFGDLVPLAEVAAFAERVRALRQSAFLVYAKPPFGGPERVLAYLARYTHRTAIANSRLVAVDDDHVAFSYKDYRRGGRSSVMRLAPHEFIRRFLLHVLPDGFHRIRHYGFLAKGDRGDTLAHVRNLLHEPDGEAPPQSSSRRRSPLTNRSPSARIAAASCAAWGPSRRRNPAPFAATHHDRERRPDLDRLRFPGPPRQFPAGAEVQRFVRSPSACFSLDPVVVAIVRAVQTPAAERSNRSAMIPPLPKTAPRGSTIKSRSALSP